MNTNYLTGLNNWALLTAAGYPEDFDAYSNLRADYDPPWELLRKVWPWLDAWVANLEKVRKIFGIQCRLKITSNF